MVNGSLSSALGVGHGGRVSRTVSKMSEASTVNSVNHQSRQWPRLSKARVSCSRRANMTHSARLSDPAGPKAKPLQTPTTNVAQLSHSNLRQPQ